MKVKIVKCRQNSFWYTRCVGLIIDVKEESFKCNGQGIYFVEGCNFTVDKSDVEVIEDV